MFKYLAALKTADAKTRWFFFQVFIYAVLIIFTTIFAYARLDYVRSYDVNKTKQQIK